MNSHEVFIHIHQGCFAGTGAIVRLPQCQWSKPDGYGKISQCMTTTKHSKAKTVCIFLGMYCTYLILSIFWSSRMPYKYIRWMGRIASPGSSVITTRMQRAPLHMWQILSAMLLCIAALRLLIDPCKLFPHNLTVLFHLHCCNRIIALAPVELQYIPINMHTALLCFALLWLCNRS